MNIYKYHLPLEPEVTLEIPAYGEVLHVGVQNGGVYLWVRFQSEDKLKKRTFRVYPTGKTAIAEGGLGGLAIYIGTVFINDTVWHIFEVFKGIT